MDEGKLIDGCHFDMMALTFWSRCGIGVDVGLAGANSTIADCTVFTLV